jgi:hypothetical protein
MRPAIGALELDRTGRGGKRGRAQASTGQHRPAQGAFIPASAALDQDLLRESPLSGDVPASQWVAKCAAGSWDDGVREVSNEVPAVIPCGPLEASQAGRIS